MKLLIIDQDACGLAYAWRAALSGHQVRWWIEKKPDSNPRIGENFHKNITKVDNWVPSMKWADLVFSTSNGSQIDKLDAFKKRGFKNIFAPSQKAVDLEVKRGLGMKFLEANGIKVPESIQFKTLKEAEKHVIKTNEAYVFKTLGDNDDKSLSYVGKDADDLLNKLVRWQELGMNPEGDVMLQKKVSGIEFAVCLTMGHKGFVGKVSEAFEHKKLMPGNFGVNTGEMGTVAKYVDESKLADMVLRPLEKALLKIGAFGQIDVNCIIDDKGQPWPLEFTIRPGWPISNLMLTATKGDPIKWMLDLLQGKDTIQVNTEASIIVVMCQPKFPFAPIDKDYIKETTGVPIFGITKKNLEHIQPQGVMITDKPTIKDGKVVQVPMWASAGDYLLCVTGFGTTVKKAAERAYGTIDEINVSNSIVRTHIGDDIDEKLKKLQKMGFATNWRTN